MVLQEIKNEDRAYFAGLFDGEGTVGVSKRTSKSTNAISYSLHIKFTITYKKVLIEMQKFFGGNIQEVDMKVKMNCNSTKRRVEFDNTSLMKWKQQYVYNLSGSDTLYFLKIIEPFCREKKQQVSLAIRFQEGRKPNPYSSGRSKSETERCELFYRELQRMKHEQEINDDKVAFKNNQQTLSIFEI